MPKLFMIQLGGRPKGRLIEQHDMFFGVATHIGELIPAINKHWPEVKNAWHIDAYRTVTYVGGYRVEWCDGPQDFDLMPPDSENQLKLFFINLGGYLSQDFEEYHYKLLVVAPTQSEAIKQAKQSEFYKKFGFNDQDTPFNAASHIDDKHQVDIDEIYDVNGLLSRGYLSIYPLENREEALEDKLQIGYLSLRQLKKMST